MEIPGPSARRRMLISALSVVAAAPSAQVAWLEKYDVPADEIALGFDGVFPLAGGLVEEGELDPGALCELQMIDEVFEEMTRDAQGNRWTRAVLSTDAGWARARHLARAVLVAEGESDPPLPEICIVR
ncbi:hypothetical protein [Streptomyces sp. NPDC020817]|uniref:hypothetical protein n=1 Tax=Streptomyces sp. NPDC020817 TaxID=3365095 RepID=UPI0037B3A6A8